MICECHIRRFEIDQVVLSGLPATCFQEQLSIQEYFCAKLALSVICREAAVLQGSCLCGVCVFTLKGRVSAVGKCHCSKCRKVSGTGSNAVHWARPENVVWETGEDAIKHYANPDGWGTAFCSHCGSPLPVLATDGSMWFVPAGLLDEDPGVSVRGHIWTSSKPSWEIIGDDSPQYSENQS